MDRRYLQFFVVSLAIIVGSQALQTWLFPAPPKPAAEEGVTAEGGSGAAEETAEPSNAVATKAPVAAADLSIGEPSAAASRVRRTLGSLDPAAARMLVTLTSRGAAVERIELADEKFHDQDDRSGYLGHLAVDAGDGGCRVGVVGPGTPAARAGLKAGDVIAKVDGTPTPDALALRDALVITQPRKKVALEVIRDGGPMSLDVTLDRRPLEVVRPEYRSAPVDDPDGVSSRDRWPR